MNYDNLSKKENEEIKLIMKYYKDNPKTCNDLIFIDNETIQINMTAFSSLIIENIELKKKINKK